MVAAAEHWVQQLDMMAPVRRCEAGSEIDYCAEVIVMAGGFRSVVALACLACGGSVALGQGDPVWPQVSEVAAQPLISAIERLTEALRTAGNPLDPAVAERLAEVLAGDHDAEVIRGVQELLDPLCLIAVEINPESRVKVIRGPAAAELVENGWRTFLVKVYNHAGVTARLACDSPQAAPMFRRSTGSPDPEQTIALADVRNRWLDIALPDRPPLRPELSGLALEYRLVQLYSRDSGQREATLAFDVGQGTQDLGFRNEVPILFRCLPAREVRLRVRDTDGQPTMAGFEVRDPQGRVYPNRARRLAPDFFFHNQVYRADGESLSLPAGEYQVRVSRGPEYLPLDLQLVVESEGPEPTLEVQLSRWIDPRRRGWYSGDHHVHAAGCAHYDNPTEGVLPEHMFRHLQGEGVSVGCVLSWGPCWYAQKSFFEGRPSDLSTAENVMRYDVEVSGFPSSHAGHLCLLRLSEDDYPGTSSIDQWPSWTLPVLQWGQQQEAVVGYSHSGWGLALPDHLPGGGRGEPRQQEGGRAADRLPDYAMPRFDGIGANEYIVTATHDAVDFISTVDTPAIWELNIWYHALNCGLRTRISGETDFPCIYGERVGLGRVYVQLDDGQPLGYDRWVRGLKDGRSYCGDGRSHVLRLEAGGVSLGGEGDGGAVSQLKLDNPQTVRIEADVAAWLPSEASDAERAIHAARLDEQPYWHLARCRIGDSRRVPVELVAGGQVVATSEIEADGNVQQLSWEVPIDQSTWLAVRILPSVHTNPIFVEVAGQPTRASRASAEWCRRAVDVCWESKREAIREEEREAAAEAYDHARDYYDRVIEEAKEGT